VYYKDRCSPQEYFLKEILEEPFGFQIYNCTSVINVGWEVSGDISRWIIERKVKFRKHKIKKVGSVAGIIMSSKRVEGKNGFALQFVAVVRNGKRYRKFPVE